MYAIPPRVETTPERSLTGLSCPDCCGGLTVRAEGKRPDLVFECRVGHTYAVDELLVAKEERLHGQLWSGYTALTELVALLGDLTARGADEDGRRYAERAELAHSQASRLRRVIEDNRPVALRSEGYAS